MYYRELYSYIATEIWLNLISSKKDFIIKERSNLLTSWRPKILVLDRKILRMDLILKESKNARRGETTIVLIKRRNITRGRGACVAPAIINLWKLEPFLFVGTIKGHTMRICEGKACVTNASPRASLPPAKGLSRKSLIVWERVYIRLAVN